VKLCRGYDGLVDIGFDKHFRGNHGNNEFARGKHHVNGIESFWKLLPNAGWRSSTALPIQPSTSKPLSGVAKITA